MHLKISGKASFAHSDQIHHILCKQPVKIVLALISHTLLETHFYPKKHLQQSNNYAKDVFCYLKFNESPLW